MAPSEIVVGLDIGYGEVKAVTNDGRSARFPALTVKIDDTSLLSPEQRERLIKDSGSMWLAGQDAVDLRRTRPIEIDSRRIATPEFRALGVHALRQLGVKRASIITGLPIKDYRDQRATLQQVVQSWSMNGMKLRVSAVVPQPVGTLADVAINTNVPDALEGRVAIIDIGSGTTDLMEVNRGNANPHPDTFATDTFAVSVAYKLIRNSLLLKHKADYDLSEITSIIKQEHVIVRGKEIPIGTLIKDAKRHVVLNALALAKRLWGDLDTYRYIVATGGGSAFLREELEAHIPAKQLIIPEDPGMANARGYLAYHEGRRAA